MPAPAFQELTLDEILGDPIVQILMRRDGVSDGDIRRLVNDTQPRIASERMGAWRRHDRSGAVAIKPVPGPGTAKPLQAS